MKTYLVGCSWKGYLQARDGRSWLETVRTSLLTTPEGGRGVFVCPPAPLIAAAVEILEELDVAVGAQDVSRFPAGPFTGEVSAPLLADLGTTMVMVGHPERARHLGETLDDVVTKTRAVVESGLTPVLVIGEQSRRPDAMMSIRSRLSKVLESVPRAHRLVVAYEPTWAIGQPRPAPPDHVVHVVAEIRRLLADRTSTHVIYGGSAVPGVYRAMARHAERVGLPEGLPDGVFLGRASVEPGTFLMALEEVRSVCRELTAEVVDGS